MPTNIINTAEDMSWLRETHLPKLSPRFLSAVITGNEDSPDLIEVYTSKVPQKNEDPVAYSQNVNGDFDLAFDRQAMADAFVTFAMQNDSGEEQIHARLTSKCKRTRKLSTIGLTRHSHNSQWEAIDALDEVAREHYFALLRMLVGAEEGQKIVANYERIQKIDGVTIKLSNREDDPFVITFEIHDEIADAWANAHGSVCGGTWECADMGTSFVYDMGSWYADLFDELKEEGYKLDFSEYSEPDEQDLAIINHAMECPKCANHGDFQAAKKHVEGVT